RPRRAATSPAARESAPPGAQAPRRNRPSTGAGSRHSRGLDFSGRARSASEEPSEPLLALRAKGASGLSGTILLVILRPRLADVLEQLVDDALRRHALGLAVEVGHDAMPQHQRGDGADMGTGHVVFAGDGSTGLRAEHQVLHRSRPGAPAHELL